MEGDFRIDQKYNQIDVLTNKVLLVLVFLLPFFFIPTPLVGFLFGKTALLVIGVMLALITWGINVLRTATLRVPHLIASIVLLVVPFAYFLSALLGPATRTSLIGHNLPLESVFVVASLFLLGLLIAATTQSQKHFLNYYKVLGISLLIVALIHIARFIIGFEILSFGSLVAPTASPLGKWNDLAVFFGLGTILSLIFLITHKTKRLLKTLLYVVLVVSLFFLMVVNFTLAWYAVGIVALLLLVHLISQRPHSYESTEDQSSTRIRNGIVPLIVTIVFSGIFIVGDREVGVFLSNSLDLNHIGVRPSTEATLDVTRSVMEENPIFGVGPNRFSAAWLQHKPDGINETAFWQIEFNSGIGVIPSSGVTVGLVGLGSWLLLIAFILHSGFNVLVHGSSEKTNRFLTLSSLIGTLYLLTFMIIYTPDGVLQALTLVFTGLFISSLYVTNHIRPFKMELSVRPVINFVATLVLLVLIFTGALGAYVVAERISGEVLYQKGLQALDQGNIDESQNLLLRATRLYPNDVYHRALSRAYLLGLNRILQDRETPQDLLVNQFQVQLGNAIAGARRAVEIDETYYANWVSLGTIYDSITPLNIQGAYEEATVAYTAAAKRNPGPDIFLTQARLEAQRGNNETARAFIGEAIEAKGNYIDAVFLLAQIQLTEGDIAEAIRSVEIAAQASPGNPVILFQLGLLQYSNTDYERAINTLETAISLSPVYANAKYFLGLAYSQIGRNREAIEQFENIAETNPDNQEVTLILSNLRAGNPPFTGAQPPLDTAPEEREELPIEENKSEEGLETETVE